MYHKGEYELLEILILLRDANCAMTTTEIAKRITGKVDETTLRRIRRKLNMLEKARFVKSIGRKPKSWFYNVTTFVFYDEMRKRHVRYVIAALLLILRPFGLDYGILETLPEPEKEEIEKLVYEVALRDDLKEYALSHLKHGYPRAFALYTEGDGALKLYHHLRKEFKEAINDALKQRFKYAVITGSEADAHMKCSSGSKAYYVYSDRIVSICEKALNYYLDYDYAIDDYLKGIRLSIEGDGWGAIRAEGGIILGIGDERLLQDLDRFFRNEAYYHLKYYGPKIKRSREKFSNCFRKLRDEICRIIHEARQGVSKGICRICLMKAKGEE
ncbi:MAG: hypothetical protein DRJ51_09305 [Thermoprotei archaeon]|nr:MAG: hypothetical protein DRJ51_09305 [Thermoprotei archaeon]